jgi:Alpha-L-arabinofuranosidase B, catalytic
MRIKAFLAPLALFTFLALISPPSQAQFNSGFLLSQSSSCSYPLPIGSDTVSVAYGVRLLRAAYAAPSKLVRVQRTSDNTQSDIGTVNSCDFDSATFNTFCNATTCFVAKWYDQSGNGNDVTQATFSNMPQLLLNQQNGHPALVFNGTSDSLTATLSAGVAAETFADVLKQGTSSNGFTFILGNATSSTYHEMGVGTAHAGRIVASVAHDGTEAYSNSTWYRFGGILSNTLASIYENGTKGTDDATSTTLVSQTSLSIGTFSTSWLNGSMTELIIFSPNISSTDLLTVSSNQSVYWGI